MRRPFRRQSRPCSRAAALASKMSLRLSVLGHPASDSMPFPTLIRHRQNTPYQCALRSRPLQSPLQNHATFPLRVPAAQGQVSLPNRREVLSSAGNKAALVLHPPERAGYTSIRQAPIEAGRQAFPPKPEDRLFPLRSWFPPDLRALRSAHPPCQYSPPQPCPLPSPPQSQTR